jgi:hypothetical protein
MGDRVLTLADARRLGQRVQPSPPLQSLVRLAVDVAVADAWAADLPRARRGDEALRSFTAEFKGAGSALEQARRLRERMVELRREHRVHFGPCYTPLVE